MLDLIVDAKPLQMELDTGASVSLISEKPGNTFYISNHIEDSHRTESEGARSEEGSGEV